MLRLLCLQLVGVELLVRVFLRTVPFLPSGGLGPRRPRSEIWACTRGSPCSALVSSVTVLELQEVVELLVELLEALELEELHELGELVERD